MWSLRCNNDKLCNCTDIAEPPVETWWQRLWKDPNYGQNLGSYVRTTLKKAIIWMETSSFYSSKDYVVDKGDMKVILIVVYDNVVLPCHGVPQRQMINSAYHCNFLRHQHRPALKRKRRYLLATNPIFLHDNVRCHTANAVMYLLHCCRSEILEHPPYSPDLSPCNSIFSKM